MHFIWHEVMAKGMLKTPNRICLFIIKRS